MSFSANAKAEICRAFPQKACCARAECFGVLLFGNSFGPEGIRIITESREFAQILPKLFRKAFSVSFDLLPGEDGSGKQVFGLTDPKKIGEIMGFFGFSPENTVSLHVNLAVVEEDCCKAAFLRGAFLAGGSVTDPEKGYHLELTTTHNSVPGETYMLLHEVLGFYPKLTRRGGSQVLYCKKSEHISDLLTYLGAPVASMGIMEARVEKEMNNRVNRRCNCDDANISKVVDAAQAQLAAIRLLRERGELESLPPKLSQAAMARWEHPEASLTELAAMMEPPITKSAMNHRLRQLAARGEETDP